MFLPATLITFLPALHSTCAPGKRDLIIRTSVAQTAVLPVSPTGCCAGPCQQKARLKQGQKFPGLCLNNGVEIAGGGEGKGSVEEVVISFSWTKCFCWSLKSCPFCGIYQLEGFLRWAPSTACVEGWIPKECRCPPQVQQGRRGAIQTFLTHLAELNQPHILVHVHRKGTPYFT